MKKWFYLSLIVVLLVTIIGVAYNTYTDSLKREISSKMDTSLDSYRNAKNLVLFFPKYLALKDDKDYQELRDRMKDFLSDTVYEELFYFDKYPIELKDVEVHINTVRGHIVSEREFEFKLDINYISSGVPHRFIYLLRVDNGVITSIQKVK